jgi:hypothetical protein
LYMASFSSFFPVVFLLKPFWDLSVLPSYRRVPAILTARF